MMYKTIFISDTHLGGSCNYSALYNFLDENEAETWYIVGDFIDFWAVKRNHRWPNEATKIVQKILKKAGMEKFIILPGNHDSELRNYAKLNLGNISIVDTAIHTAIGGRKFLVLHGDAFDPIVTKATWLSHIGSHAYDSLVLLNNSFNGIRKFLHLSFWSFSSVIKKSVKSAVSYIGNFEDAVVETAMMHDVDGVICGHIHTPVVKQHNNLLYLNCGDWVESLSFIAEDFSGRLELIWYQKH